MHDALSIFCQEACRVGTPTSYHSNPGRSAVILPPIGSKWEWAYQDPGTGRATDGCVYTVKKHLENDYVKLSCKTPMGPSNDFKWHWEGPENNHGYMRP